MSRNRKNKDRKKKQHSRPQRHYATGQVDMKGSGAAFIISAGSSKDIYIPRERTNHAMHGDIVKVAIKHTHHPENRPEGEIVEILERGKTTYSGTIRTIGQVCICSTR